MSTEETKKIVATVEEVMTFPILTRQVGADPGVSSSGGLNGGSLNRTAQQTLRDLLGWRYRSGDASGFTAALSKAFTPKDVDGYTQWQWKAQSFSLQADLGAITGAQASIHAQALATVDRVLPLLDGLEALRADVDEEDSEAIRSIVSAALRQIVDELALKSGPRVQRIDLYLNGLLGADSFEDPEHVGGQLELLRERFGLASSRVNTIDEERNLTNFIVLVDQLNSLNQAWQAKRSFFARDLYSVRQPFLGTQLVQLAEILDVIVEQVHESYTGMDSVFFGAAERQATLLRLGTHSPITVAELMSWIESFATGEGRSLLQDSGKDGVVAFHATLKPLAELARAAAQASDAPANSNGATTPAAFHARRVAVLLGGLALHLESAVARAAEVQQSRHMPRFVREWVSGSDRNVGYDVRRWPMQCLSQAPDQIVKVDEGREQIVRAALAADHCVKSTTIVFDSGDPVFDLSAMACGRYDLLLEFKGRVVHVYDAVEVVAPPKRIADQRPSAGSGPKPEGPDKSEHGERNHAPPGKRG